MKRHLLICASFGFIGSSCEKHDSLRQQSAALATIIREEQTAIEQLDRQILALDGREGGERLRFQLEQLRMRVALVEAQNASRAKKWADLEAEFARLKPAAEAYKSAHSR